MWRPPIPINFLTLHYAWIIFCSLLGIVVLLPYGNVPAIDAYFFGASASTESGLNTIDVKDLKTYQQLFLYFIPIFTNLGFINIIVVAVRLYWFEQHIRQNGNKLLAQSRRGPTKDVEAQIPPEDTPTGEDQQETPQTREARASSDAEYPKSKQRAITFSADANPPPNDTKALYVPPPKERDNDEIKPVESHLDTSGVAKRRPYLYDGPRLSAARSIEQAAASMFVLGPSQSQARRQSDASARPRVADLPYLSKTATVGRNSQFHNLTAQDRDRLGGIEYRSLKLLLKIVAVYSAQTMVDNLGFTLTPDSMISFRDAAWPMFAMSFLAFAGNTCYPVVLRLVIWTMSKLVPKNSSMRETLQFLLEHPRRCYTLLFPSSTTWILFGILFTLNFIDVVLILALDLNNPEVNALPTGPRILAVIFQAASSRHTGASTFNLANVNPGAQFSLLVMMYIAIFPIAISMRSSNTYEEISLGFYPQERALDESRGSSYVMTHVRNQLSFDLWYVFLGTFCICVTEADKIMNLNDPAFSVFAIFFEVMSGYGNVGLSLGHPDAMTSLSGKFRTFSKVVICAMMIRGRHRGLPYALDRAIMLPDERRGEDGCEVDAATKDQ
ncbi:hypothetical protein DL766_003116 [Monosporascus sp. MC13-8B]|uniref:Potassium transport protein n=1 Tax=Monosporascus cannonballus TaxID=155416 RepID=A0ABY0H9X9_9PEZI|nr:hypothetical protein DL763_008185 [Monosporascus cannonballus]RYO88606.1 hypothetical protein DL762_003642 [Monosporascus cannonballus]RYP34215.1 hypothetical protein DL766_003116 [Monosporascus sp. MC13-8B]